MKQSSVDELIERGTAAQGAIQNFLETKGSIIDISEVPNGVVEQCTLAWNNLEIFLTKLKAEGGD